MIAMLNHNQMTGAVKRNTVRLIELAVACAFLADGPQVLPIAVLHNLDAMVVKIAHDDVALVVECGTKWTIELPVAWTFTAKSALEARPDSSNSANSSRPHCRSKALYNNPPQPSRP